MIAEYMMNRICVQCRWPLHFDTQHTRRTNMEFSASNGNIL